MIGYDSGMIRSAQSGNILFYIFFAVILFGGLSFAVSQSGRGSLSQISDERGRLAATEIIDYADTLAKAVGAMRLRGTTLETLRFSDAALPSADYDAPGTQDATHEVFNTEGGNMIYRRPPVEASASGTAEHYAFLSAIAITDIGTNCAQESCADLVVVVPGLAASVCDQINILGGNTARGDPTPTTAVFNFAAKFRGTMAAPSVINHADLAGRLYGCVRHTADNQHYFYRVLWVQ